MSSDNAGGRTPHSVPGWYPDPDGNPGAVRWWSGAAWTADVRPAALGKQWAQPVEARLPRRRWPLVLGGTALGIVAVFVIAAIGGGSDQIPSQASSGTATAAAQVESVAGVEHPVDASTCEELAEQAKAIETASTSAGKLLQVYRPALVSDQIAAYNAGDVTIPGGSTSVTVLRCNALGTFDTGSDVPITIELQVDLNGDAWVWYGPRD